MDSTKKDANIQRLSDDWLSSMSHWFKEYEDSNPYDMPETVNSLMNKNSFDTMKSTDIMSAIHWLSENPLSFTKPKTGLNSDPYVIPYVDRITGKHPVGYYDFDEKFLDYAMSKGWLSLLDSWNFSTYPSPDIADPSFNAYPSSGIADTFEEVQSHMECLFSMFDQSQASFVRQQKFVILVRETDDFSLVHEFYHVGEWGKELFFNSPIYRDYVKKENAKMKKVIHDKHLKSPPEISLPIVPKLNDEISYESTCQDFANNKSGREKIFQFEILNIKTTNAEPDPPPPW